MKSNENSRIALIVPFFGTLPKYFKLFEFSLRFNQNIDVFLFTDQNVKANLPNLYIKNCSFLELTQKIEKKFDFKIILDRPYKLCDYKPAYGYIFEDILKNYDFWGYCDLDLVFGDVLNFLPEHVLNSFEKIYQFGHLGIYKNTEENNRRFMLPNGMDYKNVFSSKVIAVFDEMSGMQKKYELLGIPVYMSRDCADISPWHDRFLRAENYLDRDEKTDFNYKYQVFFWQNGKIFRAYYFDGEICYEEFNYLHFQKRNLNFDFEIDDSLKSFFITKYGFIKREAGFNVTLKDIKRLNGFNIFREMQIKFKHFCFIWKRRLNKYILKK